MQFPNAAKGVKKIYTAEILELIAALAMLLTTILGAVTLASMSADSAGGLIAGGLGFAVFGIGALVLSIIAFFMQLSGINAAKLDEPKFKNALIALIVGIVLQVVNGLIGAGLVKDLCGSLAYACDMLVTIYIVQGIGSLAEKLNNSEIAEKSKSLITLLEVVWIVAVILNAVGGILTRSGSAIAVIVSVAAGVAAIVAYIIFLGLLKKAKAMLEAA